MEASEIIDKIYKSDENPIFHYDDIFGLGMISPFFFGGCEMFTVIFGRPMFSYDENHVKVFARCDFCRTNKWPTKGIDGENICVCCGAEI